MRRSIDSGGSAKAYLVVQLTFSFLVMILLNPVRTGNYTWGWTAVEIGLFGGILLGFLMWGIGKTLEKGPPGLSFAILNTSSVMPGILLALIFGATFGHPYTLWNGLGSIIVVLGLLWAGWTSESNPQKFIWACYAAFIFIVHALFLVFLQWWSMLHQNELPLTVLLPLKLNPFDSQWFMPAVLFAAAAFQWIIYIVTIRKRPKKEELKFGMLGGIAHGICTFFLILAPQKAAPWENAMIFPIFSVAIILICNGWAQILYKEKVNWKANTLSLIGLILGTVAWNAL